MILASIPEENRGWSSRCRSWSPIIFFTWNRSIKMMWHCLQQDTCTPPLIWALDFHLATYKINWEAVPLGFNADPDDFVRIRIWIHLSKTSGFCYFSPKYFFTKKYSTKLVRKGKGKLRVHEFLQYLWHYLHQKVTSGSGSGSD
jgi:hypothetical protein